MRLVATAFLLDRRDVSELVGISPAMLSQLPIQPVPSELRPADKQKRLFYDARDVVKYHLDKLQQYGDEGRTIPEERARLLKAQGDRVEIQNDILRGKLIPFDDVLMHWEGLFVNFKTKMLAIPMKAAQAAIGAGSIEDIEDEIRYLVLEALDELSSEGVPDEHRTIRDEGTGSAKGSGDLDGQPVGRRAKKTKPGSKRGTGPVAN